MRTIDVFQRRRNVALSDPQREALHHSRLSHARFARQDGIVLAAPHQNVDHLPDFEIAPQHRIDLALARIAGEIDGVLIEIRRLPAAELGDSIGARFLGLRRRGVFVGSLRDLEQVFL